MNEDSLEQPHANPSVPNYTTSTETPRVDAEKFYPMADFAKDYVKRSALEKLVSLMPEHKHGTFDFNDCEYCKALTLARKELNEY